MSQECASSLLIGFSVLALIVVSNEIDDHGHKLIDYTGHCLIRNRREESLFLFNAAMKEEMISPYSTSEASDML